MPNLKLSPKVNHEIIADEPAGEEMVHVRAVSFGNEPSTLAFPKGTTVEQVLASVNAPYSQSTVRLSSKSVPANREVEDGQVLTYDIPGIVVAG